MKKDIERDNTLLLMLKTGPTQQYLSPKVPKQVPLING